MQRIGVIGVGEIGRAIVTGLCEGPGERPQVFLSPRGARAAAELSQRYADVHVCASNQEVVDRAELVVIAVRPPDRHDALAGLRVADDTIVVNVMAGVAVEELRKLLDTGATLVRAIPLPAVRDRDSVTVTWPSHPVTDALFERLGGVLAAEDEAAFNVFSALTATLTTHLSYLATLSTWAAGHGVPPEVAEGYVRGLFQGLGRALGDESRSLARLAADHETPNGSNERVRTTWFTPASSQALAGTLDDLLDRLA
ncbi:NAD(P)-binding domain-containing protein [Nonomuraea sp. NPDC049655]|uniref:NAD(P)-binding domain-containing protein n=1 Tax=Nonomuraea sp. NPDC049655 TaxID=3364355 RepID=UPI00378C168D